jgi:hypothetical protein
MSTIRIEYVRTPNIYSPLSGSAQKLFYKILTIFKSKHLDIKSGAYFEMEDVDFALAFYDEIPDIAVAISTLQGFISIKQEDAKQPPLVF